jgi:hypothetical protein
LKFLTYFHPTKRRRSDRVVIVERQKGDGERIDGVEIVEQQKGSVPKGRVARQNVKTTYERSSNRSRSPIVRSGQSGRVETGVVEESTICRIQPSFADQTAHLERPFVVLEVIKDSLNQFRGESFPAHGVTWKSLIQAFVLSKSCNRVGRSAVIGDLLNAR